MRFEIEDTAKRRLINRSLDGSQKYCIFGLVLSFFLYESNVGCQLPYISIDTLTQLLGYAMLNLLDGLVQSGDP